MQYIPDSVAPTPLAAATDLLGFAELTLLKFKKQKPYKKYRGMLLDNWWKFTQISNGHILLHKKGLFQDILSNYLFSFLTTCHNYII